MAMGKAPGGGGGAAKGLGAILALGPPPGSGQAAGGAQGPGEGDSEGGDSENAFDKGEGGDDMLVGAAHDVMSSLRARDAESFAVALKDFVGMC